MEILEDVKNITLCIVTKKRSKDEIMHYYNLGYRVFGENKAQELLEKISLPSDIKWHYIGHLQKNKIKKILPHISMIQSIDSISLLEEIEKQCIKLNKKIDVLIQFNISKEINKTGLDINDAFTFFSEAIKFSHIQIKGIMLMGPNVEDRQQIRTVFKKGKELFDNLKKQYPSIDTLSMGMSNDYKIAIEEGATMVRIGSILFN